jgi:uncharacterized protein YcbK (DUF882 family)
MGDLSHNFDRDEFECPCCHKVVVRLRLISALQKLRDRVKCPITVTSGFRCTDYNKKVGGVRNSQHISGEAADIHIHGMDAKEMYGHALSIPAFKDGGIGIYPDRKFIHVDVRTKAARWAELGGKKVSYFDYAKWEDKNGKVSK